MLVITEKQTPLVHFSWLFDNQTVFLKFECIFFDQVAIDAKSVPTFKKWLLMADLKLKMSQNGHFFMFSISALPSEGAFQMSVHF